MSRPDPADLDDHWHTTDDGRDDEPLPPLEWTDEAETEYHRLRFMRQELADDDFCPGCDRLWGYCVCNRYL